MNNLEVLLGGTSGATKNVEEAIKKLVLLTEDDNRIKDVINDLMNAQSKMVNLERGLIETMAPNDHDYLEACINKINITRRNQEELIRKLYPFEDHSEKFIK